MVMKNPPAQAGGFSLRGVSVKEGWRLVETAIPFGLILGPKFGLEPTGAIFRGV